MDTNLVLHNLQKNNIQAFIVKDREQAKDKVENMIKPGATVVFGGSITLEQCGITQMVKKGDYITVDTSDKASMFSADYMLCSANAITQDGLIYNVDGASNRVACICNGPKKVIIVAGINKIVSDLEQAILRVKHIAAPKNCIRLKRNTPCSKTNRCISDDINKGCDSADRICCNYVVTAKQREKDRITVIIVEEELGY